MILENHNYQNLLDQYPIIDFDIENDEHCIELSNLSTLPIIATGGELPNLPPFEKHPYLSDLIPDDLITGIMIGTFPPISYMCDSFNFINLHFGEQTIRPPDFPYFHGNSKTTSLWQYCLLNYKCISLKPREERPIIINQILINNGIIYTDMIKYCQRSLSFNNENEIITYSAEDTNLHNIVLNKNVFEYLMSSNNINRIYFTNASFFVTNQNLFTMYGDYSLSKRDAFQLFLKGAQDNGYKIDFSLPNPVRLWYNINEGPKRRETIHSFNNILSSRVSILLRLSKDKIVKTFNAVSCLSPAAVNRGKVRQNACVQQYMINNDIPIANAPEMLLKDVLYHFFQDSL